MMVKVKIKRENGVVTITVGSQPGVNAGAVVDQNNLGARNQVGGAGNQASPDPGGAGNQASPDPGGAGDQASPDPGDGPGSGVLVIGPIVLNGFSGGSGSGGVTVVGPFVINGSVTGGGDEDDDSGDAAAPRAGKPIDVPPPADE